MTEFHLAALAAAACWAFSSLIAPGPSGHLGALGFNRIRMTAVFVMLAAWVAWSGSWQEIEKEWVPVLLLSGFIGIFVGDTAIFLTLNRLGPRRTSILFSTNAPMAALLGWLALGETLTLVQIGGIVTVFAGVALAILFGKRRSQLHQWETVKGPLWLGVALGLTAALGQAGGSLIARPVMAAGADPAAASLLRVGFAASCYWAMLTLPFSAFRQRNPLTVTHFAVTAFSGFIAMALGMTLILHALSGGKVGVISTLSATSPVLLLPMLWARTGERPAAAAWIGALLVVAGSGMIFTV